MPDELSADTLVTGAEAADICDVTTLTIRQWVARGHLHRSNLVDGLAYYRLGDVMAAVRGLRAKPS